MCRVVAHTKSHASSASCLPGIQEKCNARSSEYDTIDQVIAVESPIFHIQSVSVEYCPQLSGPFGANAHRNRVLRVVIARVIVSCSVLRVGFAWRFSRLFFCHDEETIRVILYRISFHRN